MKQKLPICVLIAFGLGIISSIINLINLIIYYGDDYISGTIREFFYTLLCFVIETGLIICCFILKNKIKNINVSIVYLVVQTIIALFSLYNYDEYYIDILCLLVSAIGILIYAFDLSQNGIFITKHEEKDINETTLSSTEAMRNLEKLKRLKDNGVLTEEEFTEKSKPYIKYL